MKKKVLILGSAPDATRASNWNNNFFDFLVAINNSWKIRKDWDFNIFPKDFPMHKRPTPNTKQKLISEKEYVPAQNFFGGFVYAGGTMAYTAAYWALKSLNPSSIFFLGCDMIYSQGETHFYGKGSPDPLREDISLRSLEAKSARFEYHAQLHECQVFNLSQKNESRLVYRRKKVKDFDTYLLWEPRVFNQKKVDTALQREKALNYFVEDGKYWKHTHLFQTKEIDFLDKLWLDSIDVNL